MIRLLLIGLLVVLIGMGVLSIFSDELAADLLFFSFWLLVSAVILKVVLDFILHLKKESVEESDKRELMGEGEEKAVYCITKYRDAIRKRYGNIS